MNKLLYVSHSKLKSLERKHRLSNHEQFILKIRASKPNTILYQFIIFPNGNSAKPYKEVITNEQHICKSV